jgi:uncharacterized membrane protein YbhN (UPF0104 family)
MIVAWAVAALLVVFDIMVRAERLRLLTGGQASMTQWGAVRTNAIGDAASAITPARLGGEPARFLGLTRSGIAAPVAVVALGVERIVDLGLAGAVTLAIAGILGARGFGDVGEYASRFASPAVLPWLVGVLVVLVVAGAVAIRLRHRVPRGIHEPLRAALQHARDLSPARLGGALALTAASMAARVAILPVLLLGYGPVGDLVTAAIGSFALIYAQLLLPTPAGAGGVELGFVVGVSPLLSTGAVAGLLLTWRVFTVGIPAGLGLALFVSTRQRRPANG